MQPNFQLNGMKYERLGSMLRVAGFAPLLFGVPGYGRFIAFAFFYLSEVNLNEKGPHIVE